MFNINFDCDPDLIPYRDENLDAISTIDSVARAAEICAELGISARLTDEQGFIRYWVTPKSWRAA